MKMNLLNNDLTKVNLTNKNGYRNKFYKFFQTFLLTFFLALTCLAFQSTSFADNTDQQIQALQQYLAELKEKADTSASSSSNNLTQGFQNPSLKSENSQLSQSTNQNTSSGISENKTISSDSQVANPWQSTTNNPWDTAQQEKNIAAKNPNASNYAGENSAGTSQNSIFKNQPNIFQSSNGANGYGYNNYPQNNYYGNANSGQLSKPNIFGTVQNNNPNAFHQNLNQNINQPPNIFK